MYILKLNPVFKEIVWGGERLKNGYGYESDLNNIAEAWVLSARNDGDNTVKNGEYANKSFTELIKNHPEFLGKKGEKYNEFPLLIKFIDAKSDLSVQVHPDDEIAAESEEKTDIMPDDRDRNLYAHSGGSGEQCQRSTEDRVFPGGYRQCLRQRARLRPRHR